MSEAMDLPYTPYAGTSGHQGDASAEAEPLRSEWQLAAYGMARGNRAHGVTVAELRDVFRIHHGIASSALSTLHKGGYLAKLKKRRSRCGIYVLPEFVGDQETVPHRSNRRVGASVNTNDPVQSMLATRDVIRADECEFLFYNMRAVSEAWSRMPAEEFADSEGGKEARLLGLNYAMNMIYERINELRERLDG